MNLDIIKATECLDSICATMIFETKLGKQYFPNIKTVQNEVKTAIKKMEIFIAVDKNSNSFVGILWIVLDGAFHIYPLLHMIIVKSEHQRNGIGKALMDFYEQYIFESTYPKKVKTKSFLVVEKTNLLAQRFYSSLKYRPVCEIENLYRRSITEILMMKDVISKEYCEGRNEGNSEQQIM